MIQRALKEAMEKDKVVCVYTNPDDTTKFSVGYILSTNANETLIASISPLGRYDGYLIKKNETIFLVEFDSKYSKKIEGLFLKIKNKHLLGKLDLIKENNTLQFMLNHAQNHSLIVSIELVNSQLNDIIGLVREVNDKGIKIEIIEEIGITDGYAFCLLEDITNLEIDSEELIVLKQLIETHGL